MKKITIIIALILCIGMLVGCTGDSSEVVISASDTSSAHITANMYNFWASTSKANFMYTYSDIEDTDEFWQSEYAEGETYADYLDSLVLEDIKTTAVCLMLYNEYRLSLSDSVKESVEAEIDELLTEYADGSVSTLNSALSRYGANIDILRSIKLANEKRAMVSDYLFGEGGEMELTDEDYENYYKENYYRCQIIYINNKYEYVLDEDGYYATNSDGTYVTRALSEDTLAEKNAAIEKVKEGLDAGEDFDALYCQYSEEQSYENGYYFSANDSYSDTVFYKLIGDLSEIEVGETAVCQYDYGTYIIKRLDLDDGAWKDSANEDFFGSIETVATNVAFRNFVSQYFSKLTVNDTVISKYSVSEVNANSRF